MPEYHAICPRRGVRSSATLAHLVGAWFLAHFLVCQPPVVVDVLKEL